MSATQQVDVVIVGAGIYGVLGGIEAARMGKRVVMLEQDVRILGAASAINQARVHNGYHYPRSVTTAIRSRANYRRFVADFAEAVDRPTAFYAIARRQSKVTPAQFERFCGVVGLQLRPVDDPGHLVDLRHVAGIWQVDEAVFNADVLRGMLGHRLAQAGPELRLRTRAEAIEVVGDLAEVTTADGSAVRAPLVLNCTYGGLEGMRGAGAPRFLYELAEIAIVDVPSGFADVALTVMDGAFFSCIPHPASGGHSLSHVRFTPHVAGSASEFPWGSENQPPASRFELMVRASAPLAPWVANVRHRESVWAIKAIPPKRDFDDARPIIVHREVDSPVVSILGSKLDNVYDLQQWLKTSLS